MLKTESLVVGYVGAPVVQGVSFEVHAGEIVCMLGANGAGKSTVARTLAGLLQPREGTITIDGVDVTRASPVARVRRGFSLVPEARHLFGRSTVRDNLILGGITRFRSERRENFDRVMALFPQLPGLLKRRAGDLSGGEQQMVAIGRALMASPKYLVLDEPSLGLSPLYVDLILEQAQLLAKGGVGVLLVEQNVAKALAVGDRGIVVETGRIVLHGAAKELASNPAVVDAYLGGAA